MRKIIIAVLFVLLLASCSPGAAKEEKLHIVSTLFPQYDFAKEIAGEHAEVEMLLPSGVEAHSFEPTPKDIVKIQEADIFLYTGDAMEPWVKKLLQGQDMSKVLVVDLSEGIKMLESDHDHHDHGEESVDHDHHEHGEETGDHDHHDHGEETADHDHHDHGEETADHDHHHEDGKEAGEHHHEHGGVDPHIWLDLDHAITMVKKVEEALVKRDAKNEESYRKAAEAYIKKLQELDKKYQEELAPYKDRQVIFAGHNAFGYLAKRYHLNFITPFEGFSPDAEPTPKRLAELVDSMKENEINSIFHEAMEEPRIAKLLSEESGKKMLPLHSAHNISQEEKDKGTSYLSIMEENLKNLVKGMQP